ncbi:MAG: DUF2237 domain-containing protein [Verrucomicrobiota bacterium]
MSEQKNVFGETLEACCMDPVTGYLRDGFCAIVSGDHGTHAICAEVTNEFLLFSKSAGNDLMTPRPEFGFPGLKEGDRWCLCASRWVEAHKAGVAPRVFLKSTHEVALSFVSLSVLQEFSVDGD